MSTSTAGGAAGRGAPRVLRVALGADHAGVGLKEVLRRFLEERGVAVIDLGTHSEDSVDYPVYAQRVAEAVTQGHADQGLLVCGTGVGVGIAANKFRGVRAAMVSEPASARLAREHNNANILCLGSRIVGVELAKQILDAWLAASFQNGRHQRRLNQISEIEQTGKIA